MQSDLSSSLSSSFLLAVFLASSSSSARASPQWSGWGESNYSPQGGGGGGGDTDFGPGSSSSSSSSSFSPSSSSSSSLFQGNGDNVDASTLSFFVQSDRVLIAHAVLACAAWVFFFPVGAILLRLNIHHPVMVKLHMVVQMFAYVVFVAAAGMGIWLAVKTRPYFDLWATAHPIIGLVILALATIQPLSGWIHHRIYRSRASAFATTTAAAANRGPRPGRTVWGRGHLWLGRALITLAIINGGLGLKGMEGAPVQSREVTRRAEIGYGVTAGSIWCIYVFITLLWELRRSARKRKEDHVSAQQGSASRSARLQSSSARSSFEKSDP